MKKKVWVHALGLTIPGAVKILLKMKLTLFIILFSFFGAIASESYSQTTKLSLDLKNAKVKDALGAIENQSEFFFLYSEKIIDVTREVNIDIRESTIEKILDKIFEGTAVTYTVKGRQIVLASPEADYIGGISSLNQQQKTISGKVTDSAGASLPGVSVFVKGTTTGTITDFDGKFTLKVNSGAKVLVFSFVGMKSIEVAIAEKSSLNVVMEEETVGIEEVVAIGYGTVKKADVTGSVQSANIEAFKTAPNTNILQSLQGTVPGLNIGQIDEAGESPSITIRGTNTISGSKSPLIVVDGIIFYGGLTDLNPNDIQSVDVLKDASSMAIYGAQAANGVILITTKKGKDKGKPIINYTVSYSTQNPSHTLKILDREGFIQKVKDIDWKNAYTAASGYTEENSSYNLLTASALADQTNFDGYNNGTNYDWWAAGTNPGHIQDHQLSVSGATDKFKYYMSGGYTEQKNFIMNDIFKRFSSRMNLETTINPWLKVGAQTYGSFSDYSGASPSLNSLVLSGALRTPTDVNGDLIYQFESTLTNPFVYSEADDYDHRNSLTGNFYSVIDFPFVKGLSYQINFGNNYRWNQHNYSNIYGASKTGEAYKNNDGEYDMTFDNIISYKKTIGVHSIDATLVAGLGHRDYQYTNAYGTTFADLTLSYNSLEQAATQYIYSDAWEESSSYQMGRINYGYNNKYLVTATIRRDGFSGFAANEKTALFPSLALGWVASSESFMSGIRWMNYLKVRASYGKNGNLINRYASLAKVTSSASYVFGDGGTSLLGQEPSQLGNSNLRWEATAGINTGLDFGFLKNRIRGNVEYYQTTTKDLLFSVNIPNINGASSITSNVGEIQNSGLEFSIAGSVIKNDNLKWDLTFNFSKNTNEIKKLTGQDADGDGKEDDLISSGLFIGKSLGAIYNYQTDGFWQIGDNIPSGWSAGTEKIVDQNLDGLYTAAKDRVIIGKTEPAYRFSVQNQVSYKGFSLMIFVNSIQGGKNGYLGFNDPWSNGSIQNSVNARRHGFFSGINYWTPSNPNAEYRIPGASGAIMPGIYKDRSFVRLQDISLSYTFKSRFIEQIGLHGFKMYVSGKNLYTWTKWKGWDPELGSGYDTNGRPVMKNFTLGLDITL